MTDFLQPANGTATEGERVLVLSASPASGQVAGSREFANRYSQRYRPIINCAINSYDPARLLMLAIENAAERVDALPGRLDVITSIRIIQFRGIAYRRPVEWHNRGDNTSAVTALYVVEGNQFRQISEIGHA